MDDRRQLFVVVAMVAVLAVLAAVWFAGSGDAQDTAGAEPPPASGITVELLYFGADGCPFCAQMEAWFQDVEPAYGANLDVVKHEVSRDDEARARWEAELAARGRAPEGVPTTIIDDRVWVGFSEGIAAEIRAEIDRRLAEDA